MCTQVPASVGPTSSQASQAQAKGSADASTHTRAAALCHTRCAATCPRLQRQVLQRRRSLRAGNLFQLAAKLAAHDTRVRQVRTLAGMGRQGCIFRVCWPLERQSAWCHAAGTNLKGCSDTSLKGVTAASGRPRIPPLPPSLPPSLPPALCSTCVALGASCASLPCCTGTDPPLQCLDGGAGQICSRIAVRRWGQGSAGDEEGGTVQD